MLKNVLKKHGQNRIFAGNAATAHAGTATIDFLDPSYVGKYA